MSTTIHHPELGELTGLNADGTIQFRGLKNATLKHRFAAAELHTTKVGSEPIDATKYGPPPISPPEAIHREFGFLQQSLPLPKVPPQSDLEGLNLNITVPLAEIGPSDSPNRLPVYVFIHGGGFAVGSSWYPHYNATPLVRLSVGIGKPIIGVTINYRLGMAGFMTSKELRDAGYRANNGLHDQRVALESIRRFIGGFGGDPDEITVAGESAGAMAVTMLLCSQEQLMKRCLTTGGAVLLFKPIPQAVSDAAYDSIVKAMGLEDKSPQDRIKALLTMPADDLWKRVPPGTPLLPCIDGATIPGTPTFSSVSSQGIDPRFPMHGKNWCSAFMIGESALDANILAYMGLDARNPGIAQTFTDSVNTTLSSQPTLAQALLSAYGITESTPDDEALVSILRFATEISFYAPARAFASGWPCTPDKKFFLYQFNEGIPWPGRFRGEAGHVLDVAYLFQNFNEQLSEEQRKVARRYGENFIKFVNGEDPWPPVEGGRMNARVYGPSAQGFTAKYVEVGEPQAIGRDERVLRLGEMAEGGLDDVMEVFQNFFHGR